MDDELTINLASRERDYEVSLDICIDEEDGVVIGTGGKAQKYAAQIVIPARRYDVIEDGEDETESQRKSRCLFRLICHFAHLFFGDWRYKTLCLILMI